MKPVALQTILPCLAWHGSSVNFWFFEDICPLHVFEKCLITLRFTFDHFTFGCLVFLSRMLINSSMYCNVSQYHWFTWMFKTYVFNVLLQVLSANSKSIHFQCWGCQEKSRIPVNSFELFSLVKNMSTLTLKHTRNFFVCLWIKIKNILALHIFFVEIFYTDLSLKFAFFCSRTTYWLFRYPHIADFVGSAFLCQKSPCYI